MKISVLFATATAASVLMTAGAFAASNIAVLAQLGGAGGSNTASVDQDGGSNNIAKATQEGSGNTLNILQNGNNNWAGTHMKYTGYDFSGDTGTNYNYILQKGSNNKIDVTQTNTANYVAVDGNFNQIGDRNEILINQIGGASAGGRVNSVTQTGAPGAVSATNKLIVNQSGATLNAYEFTSPSIPHDSSDYNYANALVSTVQQTHGGGALNLLDIAQTGGTAFGINTISTAIQNGSDNNGEIDQSGRLNLLTKLEQQGDGNDAYVSQTGYNNKTTLVYQSSNSPAGNFASVVLNGIDNGQNGFSSAKGAAAAGASSATVQQWGNGNAVDYTAIGNDNEYGFYQDGTGNLADNILITGNRNELGVKQTGTGNTLQLANITGDDNILGLKQDGTSNTASITISSGGSRNGGFGTFTGLPASGAGLTPGLISQKGMSNEATFTVTGNDNVFASLQEGPGSTAGNLNKVKGVINGNLNQAAVVQIGNGNNASFTQTGGSNNAYISQ